MRHGPPIALAALLVVSLALGGCVSVQPWERETLAADRMSLDPGIDEAPMTASRRRTREESTIVGPSGGTGAGASGCGCH